MKQLKIRSLADILTGIFISCGILVLYYAVLPVHCVDPPGADALIKPSGFVRIICKIILASGIWLAFTGISFGRPGSEDTETDGNENLSKHRWKRVSATIFIFVLYIAGMQLVGFYPSSAIFMAALMFFFGTRRWELILVNIVCVLFFTFLVFKLGLRVILPESIFFCS